MKKLAFCVLLTGWFLLSGTVATAAEPMASAALISITATEAVNRFAELGICDSKTIPNISQVRQVDFSYILTTNEGTRVWIDGRTGFLLSLYVRKNKNAQNKEIQGKKLSVSELKKKASEFVARVFPFAQSLNRVEIEIREDGDVSTTDVDFKQIYSNGAEALSKCYVKLNTVTGEVTAYEAVHCHPTGISEKPVYERADAINLARWLVTGGKAGKYQVLLLSEFSAGQKATWGGLNGLGHGFEDVRLEYEEDEWLHQRLQWTLYFNFYHVTIDANTGHLINVAPSPQAADPDAPKWFEPFKLNSPRAPQKPAMIPPPETLVETSGLNFNGGELVEKKLHYPPIIRDNACLIFSEYFPKFLVNVTQKGEVITLQGQLKDKGKSATLKLGDKKAIVDGKEVVLPSGPVGIDKRLYLPAELLQLTNGIPIRWEPKKKLLYVETRYLRR